MSLYMISNKTRNAVKEHFGSYIKKTSIDADVEENTTDFSVRESNDEAASNETYLVASAGVMATRALDDTDRRVVYLGRELMREGNPTLRQGETVRIVFMRTFGFTNGSAYPFIIFCLQKNAMNELQFPEMVYDGGQASANGMQILRHIFSEWSQSNIEYLGYIRHDNETYLWYNGLLSDTYQLVSGKREDQIWFATVSEITNDRRMLTFDIDQQVTNLFLRNPRLIYLVDGTRRPYDIPMVGYFGSYYKRIGVTAALGVKKEGPTASLGPYYYFGAYPRAIRYAVWTTDYKSKTIDGEKLTVGDSGKYTRGGIVRFALFMGKQTMMLGREGDKDDDTDASRRFVKERPNLISSLKMRDTMGVWASNYDSVSQGTHVIETAKGENFTLSPQMVVKDYAQQFPLSYHYVDTGQDINKDDLGSVLIE